MKESELKTMVKKLSKQLYDFNSAWEYKDPESIDCPFCGLKINMSDDDVHFVEMDAEMHTIFCVDSGYMVSWSPMGDVGVHKYSEEKLKFDDRGDVLWVNYDLEEIEDHNPCQEIIEMMNEEGLKFGWWMLKSDMEEYPPVIRATNKDGVSLTLRCDGGFTSTDAQDGDSDE